MFKQYLDGHARFAAGWMKDILNWKEHAGIGRIPVMTLRYVVSGEA